MLQHERRPLHGSFVGTHAFDDGSAQRRVASSQMPSQHSASTAHTSPPARQYV